MNHHHDHHVGDTDEVDLDAATAVMTAVGVLGGVLMTLWGGWHAGLALFALCAALAAVEFWRLRP